jgi:hypothetical protein
MFNHIANGIFMSVPSSIATFIAIRWWIAFGIYRPYPYVLTVAAILLWGLTYIAFTEKED